MNTENGKSVKEGLVCTLNKITKHCFLFLCITVHGAQSFLIGVFDKSLNWSTIVSRRVTNFGIFLPVQVPLNSKQVGVVVGG